MKKTKKAMNKKELEELDLTGFKLLPSAKPPLFHGSTVRKTVNHFWNKKFRPAVLEQRGKVCSLCGWTPEDKTEERYLHLHEVEEYDFENKVCHLVGIELICKKCHSFEHIMRTQSVSTEEQWEDLMKHFIKVNDCSPEIVDDFELVITKAFQLQKEKFGYKRPSSFEEMHAQMLKPVRFTVSPDIPMAEEIIRGIEKKGLLYQKEEE